MRIQFESTIEKLVEASELATKRAQARRPWYRRGIIYTPLIVAVCAFIPFFIFAATKPRELMIAFTVCTLIAGFAAFWSWSQYDKNIRKRLRRYYIEHFEGRETFPSEIEIDESEIKIKQLDMRLTYEWSAVEEVEESDSKLVFYLRNSGVILLRKKDFPEEETYERFQAEAKRYLTYSRTSSNWLRGDEN